MPTQPKGLRDPGKGIALSEHGYSNFASLIYNLGTSKSGYDK